MHKPGISGTLICRHGGAKQTLHFTDEGSTLNERVTGRHDEGQVTVTPSLEERNGGWRFTLRVSSDADITVERAEFSTNLIATAGDRVMLNGYQSWSSTKEYTKSDFMRGPVKLLRPITGKFFLERYGDYTFQPYPIAPGKAHGCSWCWARTPNGAHGEIDAAPVRFAGSLDERSGFTFFHAAIRRKKMTVEKDVEGLAFRGTYNAFDIFFANGAEDDVMNRWFAALSEVSGIRRRPALPATGWTSWYNYYQNISEDIILGNLDAMRAKNIPLDVFQIDDGYQTAVGDWLSIRETFPHGMKFVADRIREAGFTPGIWLAPFAAEKKSALFRDHPDWFIKDGNGAAYETGSNWSSFYSMDIYNEDARTYVRRVFTTVLDEWGFGLVKLDFLYGACVRPMRGKTRGEIMCDAMDFLRECVGDKMILGCGVPLWPAFGKAEYCRIGTDIDLQWHNELYGKLINREFPSTKWALLNSVARHHLDGRAFVNDPDVFLLRHANTTLTPAQRRTVYYVNMIFGNLLFTSDDIRAYTDAELTTYLAGFPFREKKIRSWAMTDGILRARFEIDGREYWFAANFTRMPRKLTLPDEDSWFRSRQPEMEAALGRNGKTGQPEKTRTAKKAKAPADARFGGVRENAGGDRRTVLRGGDRIILNPFASECFLRLPAGEATATQETEHRYTALFPERARQ
jgi:alpha-galactosidase